LPERESASRQAVKHIEQTKGMIALTLTRPSTPNAAMKVVEMTLLMFMSSTEKEGS
jgi:hypothetical protein